MANSFFINLHIGKYTETIAGIKKILFGQALTYENDRQRNSQAIP